MSFVRGRVEGREGEEKVETPACEEHASRAAGEAEQNAFGEQLPNESSPARAQRGPNGEFAMARGGAGEKEIGDVRAGDEEDAADRAEQGVEHGAHIAHCVIEHRRHHDAPAFIRVGILPGELRGE